MITDKIKDFLEVYNYKFELKSNKVDIDLGQKLWVEISFNNNDSILIENCLKGWNPVSGFFNITLKKAFLYNTIGLVISLVLLVFFQFSDTIYDYTYLLIICIAVNFMWLFNYLIRFEIFKMKIELLMLGNQEKRQ